MMLYIFEYQNKLDRKDGLEIYQAFNLSSTSISW